MNKENTRIIQKWINSGTVSKTPKFVNSELLNNKDFVMSAIDNVEIKYDFLADLPEALKKDKDIVINALKHCLPVIQSIDTPLFIDKDVALALVSYRGHYLKYLSDELKNDRDVVLTSVSVNSNAIVYASEELRNDKEVVLFALSHPVLHSDYYGVYATISLLDLSFCPSLKDDKDIIIAAVKNGFINGGLEEENPVYRFLPDKYKTDPDIACYAIGHSYTCLKEVPNEVFSNKEFVLKAFDIWLYSNKHSHRSTDINGFIKIVSKELLDDIDVARVFTNYDPLLLEKLSPRLKDDKEFVITLFNDKECPFNKISKRLQKDEELFMLASKKKFSIVPYAKFIKENDEYFINIKYNAQKIKDDFEMGAAIAVGFSAMAGVNITMDDLKKNAGLDELVDTDIKIKVDEAFIIEALNNDPNIRKEKKISSSLLEDKESQIYKAYLKTQFLLTDFFNNNTYTKEQVIYSLNKKITIYSQTLDYLSQHFNDDIDVARLVIKENPGNYCYFSSIFQTDKQLALSLIKEVPSFFIYVSKELKNDREVVETAINLDPTNYRFVSNDFLKDKDIVLLTLSKMGSLLSSVPASLRFKDEIIKAALDNDKCAFIYAPISYRNNRDIVLEAVKKNGSFYRYASNELKEDKEVLVAALTNYGLALQYAPEAMKKDKEMVLLAVKNDPKAKRFAYGSLQIDKDIKKY